jgi:hypothetical protein
MAIVLSLLMTWLSPTAVTQQRVWRAPHTVPEIVTHHTLCCITLGMRNKRSSRSPIQLPIQIGNASPVALFAAWLQGNARVTISGTA